MTTSTSPSFSVGKFRLTPSTRPGSDEQFRASLSICRGSGRQTHDHVYTFTPEFPSRESALMYAAVQGLYWLINPKALA